MKFSAVSISVLLTSLLLNSPGRGMECLPNECAEKVKDCMNDKCGGKLGTESKKCKENECKGVLEECERKCEPLKKPNNDQSKDTGGFLNSGK